jgi:solute carrier family 6 amino acid/orphan transporter-like 15/16/17/18/20
MQVEPKNIVPVLRVSPKDDITTDRPRWMNRWTFLISTVSAAIGIGNVWRFPYLSFKHGGSTFIYTYLYSLFIIGIPMLILELTLGQKMQKGSAGSMRGIVPRLAGIGYVASFSGFVTALTYNILLGMSIIYLLNSGS